MFSAEEDIPPLFISDELASVLPEKEKERLDELGKMLAAEALAKLSDDIMRPGALSVSKLCASMPRIEAFGENAPALMIKQVRRAL